MVCKLQAHRKELGLKIIFFFLKDLLLLIFLFPWGVHEISISDVIS